jgi:hypothetical protein
MTSATTLWCAPAAADHAVKGVQGMQPCELQGLRERKQKLQSPKPTQAAAVAAR